MGYARAKKTPKPLRKSESEPSPRGNGPNTEKERRPRAGAAALSPREGVARLVRFSGQVIASLVKFSFCGCRFFSRAGKRPTIGHRCRFDRAFACPLTVGPPDGRPRSLSRFPTRGRRSRRSFCPSRHSPKPCSESIKALGAFLI